MICRLESIRYQNPVNGYTVAIFTTKEKNQVPKDAMFSENRSEVSFTAVGKELPDIKNVDIELEGTWEGNKKFGNQMKVAWFRVCLPKSREGMISFLSSEMVKGIGPVLAEKIVDAFGEDSFQVLDENPEKLLSIKGITEEKLKTILASYRNSAEIRELMTYLAPFHVTPKKAMKIRDHFGLEAVEIVQNNPYRLCEIKGFGFLTVDPIARSSQNFQLDSPERVKAAISYILQDAENEGHLYLESQDVLDRAGELLNKGFPGHPVSRNVVILAGNELVLTDHILEADGCAIYRKENRMQERKAAFDLMRLLGAKGNTYEISQELEEVQAEIGMVLAEKQRDAVRMVFQSNVSIITGGPGKGKTTVLKALLKVYEKVERLGQVLLCAPTGRARKRMAESTGYPALTIHKALYITAEDTEEMEEGECLEEDLIIVDEFTMADMKLASTLFGRIKSGARVVLVGDVDQLPSVGPGNVFKEMIDSGVLPVTVLDVFFRQAKDSRIILNADRINHNNRKLLYGNDFQFCDAEDAETAAEIIGELYRKELEKYQNNVDMVQVLSPLRVNTPTGVNALNRLLQEIANPSSPGKTEWKAGSVIYREGDKVMQTQNTEDVSNGEIGIVKAIVRQPDGNMEMTVCFSDTNRQYQEEDLAMLDHAYATSIHKSQGGEFPVVIIPVLKCFYPMLKRNVYYTGVTRAKAGVYLVGSKQALAMAISNSEEGKRNTLLAMRIRNEAKRKLHMEDQYAA